MSTTIRTSFDASLALARALFARDEPAQAEAILRDLVERSPSREDTVTLLAEVLRSQGRLEAASEAMGGLARAVDYQADVAVRAAAFARSCDRHGIAESICSAALARSPHDPTLLVLGGHVARESGDFSTARSRYLCALAAGADPNRHQVLGALVNTRRYVDRADPDRARCEAAFRDSRLTSSARASAGHALAKILDDVGEYGAAAAALREANAVERTLHPWDARAWCRFVAARLVEHVAAAGASDSSFVPVFVVGVPRSGTTLTASRLATATGARDRGELRVLRFIADRLRADARLGDPSAVAEAAKLYRVLSRQDDPPVRVYLDQDPLNFRWIDIAFAMFPHTRVIHVRRDPRDVAVSLWSQSFAHPDMAFSHDFDDIAVFMRGHDQLIARWQARFGAVVREVHYEELIADANKVIGGLAAFVGVQQPASSDLPDSPVTSASVWQARQPVYTSSAGRWRHYASYVPELARIGARR